MRLGRKSRLVLLLWGVRERNAYVELSDDVFARFGFYSFRTPLANVARWRIEGPWRWITAIGVRMSVRHRDVSFSGTAAGGVRLDFKERVPWSIFHVPALYVGVDDLDAFAAALAARGIPGEDARRAKG